MPVGFNIEPVKNLEPSLPGSAGLFFDLLVADLRKVSLGFRHIRIPFGISVRYPPNSQGLQVVIVDLDDGPNYLAYQLIKFFIVLNYLHFLGV